jgi:ribosomal protein S27AE
MEQLFPALVAVLVLIIYAFWQAWIIGNFDYQCGNCGYIFSLQLLDAMFAPHAFWRKLVRCPNCGQMTWAALVQKRNGY